MGTVRQKVATLIDYRGDCAKYDASTGPRMYSSDFSPNNIRRIVISPEGVMVVYHRAIRVSGSSRPYNFVRFNAVDLYKEEQSQNYKPLLSLLSSPLICSCLEEIVILSQASMGYSSELYMNEIRLDEMVRSFKGAGSDLKEKLSNRYSRLRFYTVIGCTFNQFMAVFKEAATNRSLGSYSFFTEMPVFKSVLESKTELAGEDYWKSYDVRTNIYAFDISLGEHFKNIKSRREAALKDAAVEAHRNERVGGKLKALNELIEDYLTYSKVWDSFYKIVKKEGTNGVLPDIGFVRPPEIEQVFPFKGMRSVPDKLVSKQPCSEAEALERNEALFKNYKAKCCMALAVAFMTALRSIKEPTLLQTIVNGCETTVCVPKTLDPVVDDIQRATGVVFSGKQIEVSVVNSCYQFMKYFVDCEHTAPFNKSYWEDKLRKGVAK